MLETLSSYALRLFANYSPANRRSCRSRHRQWVSFASLRRPRFLTDLSSNAPRVSQRNVSSNARGSGRVDPATTKGRGHCFQMIYHADLMVVRVCARPVSPVMTLPELFSVSTPLPSSQLPPYGLRSSLCVGGLAERRAHTHACVPVATANEYANIWR